MLSVDKNIPVTEQARQIKALLRTMMNGPVSQAMRERGLTYKVNFGVELPRLKEWAKELPQSHELAQLLWHEKIRECRILAGLLQPIDSFNEDLVKEWILSMQFPEEAECTTFHLFSKLPKASLYAFQWVASSNEMFQLCGFLLFSILLKQGASFRERDENEYLNQVEVALLNASLSVKLAAQKSLLKYMDQNNEQELKGEKLLNKIEKL